MELNHAPQNRTRANVFLCYAPTDAAFVNDLDEALKRSRRRSVANSNHDSPTGPEVKAFSLIEAADTFVFIVSPDSVQSETCLQQLDHALKKARLVVPVIHREVPTHDLPTPLAKLKAVRFDAGRVFHESFQALIQEVPTDLKVDVFICYSRVDKTFVDSLYSQLEKQERTAWVDMKSIPFAERWEQEIYRGIEAADNFIFVMSPSSIASEYCAKELSYALEQGKRIVPLLLHAVDVNAVPASLASLQWLDFGASGLGEGIQALVRTIDTDQDHTRLHTRLLTRAHEWTKSDRDDSFLLRGSDLKKAEKWLVQAEASIEPKPTQLQTQYIIRSRQAETGRQRKTTTWVTAGLVIAIALAVLATVQSIRAETRRKEADEQRKIAEQQTVIAENRRQEAEDQRRIAEEQTLEAQRQKDEALRQKGIAVRQTVEAQRQKTQKEEQRRIAVQQRDLATSRELAASASSQLDADPELSALLAVEAIKQFPSAEAEKILRESLEEARTRLVLKGHPQGLWNAAYNTDGSLIVTAGQDNRARVWDATTGKNLAVLKGDESDVDENSVRHATFSPDGKLIATAGDDDAAEVWETATGRKVADLKGHGWDINSIAFSPDGKLVVTSSRDGTARIWEAATGKNLATLDNKEWVNSAAFSPDGRWVVTASQGKMAYVWDAATGKLQAELRGHQDGVTSAAFSPDSKRVVTASSDRTAHIWDAVTGESLFALRGHTNAVRRAVFSPDGKWVATASDDQTGRLWNAETGEGWAELSGHSDSVWNVAFSPDARFVLTSSYDGTVRVWELQTEEWKWKRMAVKLLAVLRGHKGGITSATFSPDGRSILTASYDKTARIWDAPTGSSVLELAHKRAVQSAVFSHDGRLVLTSSGENEDEPDWNTARLWDATTGKLLLDLQGHKGRLTDAEFSPDDKYIVTASWDRNARVWETSTGKMVTRISVKDHLVARATFSPDGKSVATLYENGTARVWEFPDARKYVELTGDQWGIKRLAFSPNGKTLAGGGQFGQLWIWDAATGKVIASPETRIGDVHDVAFSPDGSLLVAAGRYQKAWVGDTATGKEVKTLAGHKDEVYTAAFSPDGRFIVTASKDKTARVWETKTWRNVAELRGHTDEVWQASFSPDSRFVVTASRDGKAGIWEATTGRETAELRGSTKSVATAAFSPDGKFVVTTSRDDNVARVYKCETCVPAEGLVRLAQSRIPRPPLTAEERQKYLHETPVKP